MNLLFNKLIYIGILLSFTTLPSLTFALEPAQLQSIQAASRGQYRVAWLNHRSTQQDVILIGETHVVNERRHNIAVQLVSQFPLIGIEGVRTSALPKPITSFGVSKDYTLAYKVGPFPGPIKLARARIGEDYEHLRYIVAWYRIPNEQFTKTLQRGFLSKDERGLALVPGLEEEIKGVVNEKTISTIIQRTDDFLAQTGVVELEYFEPIPESLRQLSLANGSASKALIQESIADRDSIMSTNILRMLKNRPDEKTFLVLVGEDHVEGIKAKLKEITDFTDVPLRQPK